MAVEKKEFGHGMAYYGPKKGFSIFWFLVFVLAVIWFCTEIGWLTFNVPWLPLITAVIAFGIIVRRLVGFR